MVVSRQCLPDPALVHYDEGDAVRQAPRLVEAFLVEIRATLKEVLGCRDDDAVGIRPQRGEKLGEAAARCRGSKAICKFGQDLRRRHSGTRQRSREFPCALVCGVVREKNRQVVVGVREDLSHRLGVPWM